MRVNKNQAAKKIEQKCPQLSIVQNRSSSNHQSKRFFRCGLYEVFYFIIFFV